MSIEAILSRVVKSEGGYTSNPKDPGNWTGGKVNKGELKGTKYGLSAASYPDLDIENITWANARDIYWDWYKACKLYQYSTLMQYQMFDAAFNHGMRKASQLLQRAVGVQEDGIVGPKTLAALHALDVNDQAFLFLAERLRFFTNLTHFKEFGKGWSRRIADNLKYAAQDN